jgi:hypothetical protein
MRLTENAPPAANGISASATGKGRGLNCMVHEHSA